jgi:chromatin structure-remodeling complex subunit RSC9
MSSTLKLLVTQMLTEQIEDTVPLEIGGPIHTAPAEAVLIQDHELSKEELEGLISQAEPQRCYEWCVEVIMLPSFPVFYPISG